MADLGWSTCCSAGFAAQPGHDLRAEVARARATQQVQRMRAIARVTPFARANETDIKKISGCASGLTSRRDLCVCVISLGGLTSAGRLK